jgi:transmembrane sensor
MTRLSIDEIEEEAAAWLVRMEAGAWTDQDEASLQQWLRADPRYPGILLQLQAIWSTLSPPSDEIRETARSSHRPAMTRRTVMAGGGAALAASLAGIVYLASGTRYTTEVGEIRRVPLADGSFASINTASSIDIDLSGKSRDVRLVRGEAWFQVAKDPARPFIVEAGRIRAQAVGTAFSVRRHDNGADVLVTEGIVDAWADGAEGHRIRLRAGDSAFIADNAAIQPQPALPSSVDRALAWRGGKIDLVDQTLRAAAADFNRYNQRRIVILDPQVGAETFDGVFGTNDPEGFAITVAKNLSVPVDLSDPSEIRIGKTR